MPPQKTEISTLRLSDFAKKFVYPDGIKRTVWPRVAAKGLDLGLGFDWWQSQLGTVCLGYGENGKYVATVGGIGMSIPRQVGKTYFVLAMLVILCILFPGLQVVWTAHHLRTSTKTFTALRGICRRKKVAAHVRPGGIRSANGEQQVEFQNGSIIMFGARSMGFGRGFDEIDIEVYDEAQILDSKALEDMVAATNQARHEHGALLFYMGTPPRPTDPSEAFANRRKEAWDGAAEDAIWLEIGADPRSHPDDRSQWPLMNPSFPLRTPEESLMRLKKNLKDEDAWNREGRGIWDDDATVSPIAAAWSGLADYAADPAPHVGNIVLGVDTDPIRKRTSITAAGLRADGVPMVEVIENLPGVDWVTDQIQARITEITTRNPVSAVVIDKRSAAATLIHPLTEAGVPVFGTDAQQMAQACGLFIDAAIETGRLRHLNQPELNAAVRAAITRSLGDALAWDRKKPTTDITPLTSATLALWGLLTGAGVAKNAGRGRVIALD